jgi:hypothetical protein
MHRSAAWWSRAVNQPCTPPYAPSHLRPPLVHSETSRIIHPKPHHPQPTSLACTSAPAATSAATASARPNSAALCRGVRPPCGCVVRAVAMSDQAIMTLEEGALKLGLN